MTSVVASQHRHPVPVVLLKASVAGLLLLASAAGVWHGSQALAARLFSQPPTDVSYASTHYTTSMLQKAYHSPARKAGSFVRTASLSDAHVQGVRVDNGQ